MKVKEPQMTEDQEYYTLTCTQFGRTITVSGSATHTKEVVDLVAQFLVAVGFSRENLADYITTDYLR